MPQQRRGFLKAVKATFQSYLLRFLKCWRASHHRWPICPGQLTEDAFGKPKVDVALFQVNGMRRSLVFFDAVRST